MRARAPSVVAIVAAVLSTLAACGESPFHEPMVLGGETISADVLNRGYAGYMQHCFACHGANGDGKGPAAVYLRPTPRDFRVGVFKFAGVVNPGLPHTEDLIDLVGRGLSGTAMLAWDLPDESLTAIIHYIKTFSSSAVPESAQQWSKRKKLGDKILPTEDPWQGQETEAVALGRQLYHVNAQCAKCHPAYITQEQMWQITRAPDLQWAYGELLYRTQLKASDAFVGTKILPIDFLYHPIKTINHKDSPADQRRRLYRTIGAGIQGAAMPTWRGSLDADPAQDERKLWALAYYVQSVAGLRDTPAGVAQRRALSNQDPFVPPTAAAAPAPQTGGDADTARP